MKIQEYEKDNFGEVITDLSNAEKLINAHIVYFYNNIALGDKSIIDNEAVENLYNKLLLLKKYNTLNLVLESSGGNLAAGTRLIHIIRELYKEFYVTVLNRVNSTASLIALSSDKLYLTHKSLITPFEPQMDINEEKISVSVIRNIINNVSENYLYNNLDLIILGKYYASINYFKDLIKSIFKEKQAKLVIDYMLNQVNSHQYPITFNELKDSLGVNLEFINNELLAFYLNEEEKIKKLFKDVKNNDTINSYSTIIKDKNSTLAYTKSYKINGDSYKKIYQGYKSL